MIKKLRILLLFISLSVSLCLMSNTYSRYVALANGNVSLSLASWQILVSNTDITANTESNISFVPTIIPQSTIKNGVIAPSSKGYFDISINPTNVDVAFKYTIDLALQNQNLPDLMISSYSILNSDYQEGDLVEENSIIDSRITNIVNITSTAEEFSFEMFTIRVYFEWIENATSEVMNDNADTLASINNESFSIDATIAFEQIFN